MPSFYEGLPVTGIEAQASGLPCFFSDSITKDVDISNNAKFISLELKPEKWAEIVNDCLEKFDRRDVSELVIKNGYDVKTEAKKLEKKYHELINKG